MINSRHLLRIALIVSIYFEFKAESKIINSKNFCLLASKNKYYHISNSLNQCNDKFHNISCGIKMCAKNKTECDVFLTGLKYYRSYATSYSSSELFYT